jgi:hypothetical protein
MTVTVSVDVTHRVSRLEFSSPIGGNSVVFAYGEVLLQEPSKPSEGAEILHVRTPIMSVASGDGRRTYGTMPGSQVMRTTAEVANETVDVNGTTIDFKTVQEAFAAFFDKWRVEDANKPPEPLVLASLPPPPQMLPPEE